jgi:cytochrome P450
MLLSWHIVAGFIDAQFNEEFKKDHQLSLSILKQFGFGKGLMENRITLEVAELIKELKKVDGKAMIPDKLITNCVLNIISSIIFGKRYDPGDPELEQVLDNAYRFLYESMEIVPVSFFPPLRFLPSYRRAIAKLRGYQKWLMNFIDQRIADAVSSQDESFISCFVEAEGSDYDHEQLQHLLFDLLIAGSETSSTTLRWALLLLANNPDVQHRLHNEIDSVVSRDRLPSLDDRRSLPYVEAAILETWRNKTIVPLGVAHATLSDVTIQGCHVPVGTTVC